MGNKIVVLIPSLNEERTISTVINKFKKTISSAEIHVFDNNSDDKTKFKAKKAGAIVHDVQYKGKGNVVRRMFADVDGDVFIMIDADDTYDISALDSMLKLFKEKNLDMLVGKRVYKDKNAYRFGHVFGNKLFSKLVKLIFGNQIDDLFSGFRIFSKRFVKSFSGNSKGFEIETELTVYALEQRLPVAEIECNYKSRPAGSFSKLSTFSDGFKILNLILVLVKDERPLFFFTILAIFFFTFSLIVGLPVVFDFFETGLVEKLPSAVLASINMVIGFISFFSGLILDVVKKSRQENKRFNYLK